MEKIIKAALVYLEKRLNGAMALLIKENKRNTDDLRKSLGELKVEPMKIEFPKAEKVNMKGVEAKLDQLLKKPAVEISFAGVMQELAALRAVVEKNAPEKIGGKIDALDAVFKGLKPKDSVRFDDKQMQGLMAALTNGIGGGGNKAASGWDVVAVPMPDANTEYSYTFPANTVSWTMKLRNAATFYYSAETNKLPVSGDNTSYMTVPANGTRSQDNIEWSGKTIYFESATAASTLELEVFTM